MTEMDHHFGHGSMPSTARFRTVYLLECPGGEQSLADASSYPDGAR